MFISAKKKRNKAVILAEIAEMEQQQREDEHQESLVDVGTSVSMSRRLLDANYRCTHFLLLDSFSSLVEVWVKILLCWIVSNGKIFERSECISMLTNESAFKSH